ncbi:C2HC-type_zinc-finger domain-containing protein [Hexamita inflata]|uniref:C2HC-type zinc-finger domain-containing protein n=1 Tax=Hexamita inflata TaxID=28002 RepID=A0AA86RHY4_9EUKA|nr:C2HC-type zinc-finger domain-containing protein [Hexamita inflata]
MELPNSLVCRYCGDKLLPHSIRSHERSCRRKLVKIVDMLFLKESLKFDYPPEYSEWPIPSKSDLQKYNDHAQREFKEGQQACPRCGSRFSMFEMQDHVLKCEATEFVKSSEPQLDTNKLAAKPDEKRRDQTIQLSLGVPEVTEDTLNQCVKNQKEKHMYSEKDVKAIIKLTERVQKGLVPEKYKDVHSDNSIKRILHYQDIDAVQILVVRVQYLFMYIFIKSLFVSENEQPKNVLVNKITFDVNEFQNNFYFLYLYPIFGGTIKKHAKQ